MDDHPRRPRPVDLTLLEDAEQAWFRPGTARRHRVRGLLVVAGVLALVLGGFALGPAGLPFVFLGILLGPLAAHAFSVALNAGRVWGLDEGFALAVREDGLVLPRFGFVPWDEVARVQVVENEVRTWLHRFQVWLGVRSPKQVHVYVRDAAAIGRRAPARDARTTVTDSTHRLRGWVFATSAQLEDGDLAAVVDAIWEHGREVLG